MLERCRFAGGERNALMMVPKRHPHHASMRYSSEVTASFLPSRCLDVTLQTAAYELPNVACFVRLLRTACAIHENVDTVCCSTYSSDHKSGDRVGKWRGFSM